MKKLTIGLAGTHFPNFDAIKHDVYPFAQEELSKLAKLWDFDLVVTPSGVQSAEEAQQACAQLADAGVDFILLQASSFALGDVFVPFAKMDVPLGLWAVEEPVLEGVIPLNSFTGFNLFASILRTNITNRTQPVKWFYGSASSDRFKLRLELTIRALKAIKNLKASNVALIGEVAPTFFNLTYSPEQMKAQSGIGFQQIPLDDIFKRAKSLKPAQVRPVVDAMKQAAAEVLVTDEWMLNTAQTIEAVRLTIEEANCQAVALRCWPEFQESFGGLGPCAAVGWLNEIGIPTACEGDVLSAASMLTLNYLSSTTTTLMDLVAVIEQSNLLQMWHCGPTAPGLADEHGQRIIFHPTLDRTSPPESPRSGASSDLVLAPGPITIMRYAPDIKSAYVITGEVVEGPGRGYEGSRGWIGNLQMSGETLTIPDLIETIVYHGLPHHYPLVYGNHADLISEFAAWSGTSLLEAIEYQDYIIVPKH